MRKYGKLKPDEAAKLLRGGRAGLAEWNRRRLTYIIEHSRDFIWLLGQDLSGLDLSGADLSFVQGYRADFKGANLTATSFNYTELREAVLIEAKCRRASFSNAKLTNADLSQADLTNADLSQADLTNANLSQADLTNANLSEADLTNANLSQANLSKANLSQADLSGLSLGGATVGNTTFARVDLSEVASEELLRIWHVGPSAIATSALAQSKGRIPAEFLKGCGLSDWEIQAAKLYDPALREDERTDILYEIHRLQESQPIVFQSVFISYSTEDDAFAQKLYADLQKNGVRCWFAPHDMKGGKPIHEQIERAIHLQDRLLLMLSKASMASNWVELEIVKALKREREQKRRILFPIGLADFKAIQTWEKMDSDTGTDLARTVRKYFIPDFSERSEPTKYKQAFERVLKDLRAE